MIELRASDLRQFLYCPRVVYFTYVMPVARAETFMMHLGRDAESEHTRLERRRSLARYGLAEGARRFRVPLVCRSLGVSGVVDEVIDAAAGPVPVEIKRTAGGVAEGHRAQLAVYALALEESTGAAVAQGFVHLVPAQKVVRIAIDAALRERVRKLVDEVRTIVEDQVFPEPPRSASKCDGCELRGFCNDVL